MLGVKQGRISAIGTFQQNLMVIDDVTIGWIDAKEFNTADLAKLIGIDAEHRARAKITLEIVDEHCEICGKLTTGHDLCEHCERVICDDCAETGITGRYCPVCRDLTKQPTQ